MEDFARGFTLTEGLGEVGEVEVLTHAEGRGIELQMWLPEAQAEVLAARRRALSGPVGCGLCGIDSLEQAARPIPQVAAKATLGAAHVATAMAALRGAQALHDQTRAVHGAAFYTENQGLIALREDVGRHNALDKLIGAVGDCSTGAVVLTSRVSVEMVQKSALAGCGLILAVSAPTVLAVETAQAAGITLAGFARGDAFEVYTHPQRITGMDRLKGGSFGAPTLAAPL